MNGDVPLTMRAVITLSVSNTGIASTANVNGITPKFSGATAEIVDDVLSALMTKDDIMVPIRRVPPSPMNILDFLPKTL